MGLPWNVNASMGGAGVNYQIQRSLRFRASASAYLNRTPASTGNQKIWTFSVWVKRGAISTISEILHASNTVVNQFFFQFNSDNTITFSQTNNTSTFNLVTSQVFRDPSAWYHLVAVYNSPDATASNRMSLYVNGVKVTAFSTANYPSLNFDSLVNLNNLHVIGSQKDSVYTNFFDGYLAEVNLIDGQALTPASFGYNDPVTGVWQPAPFKGTYGTNGFYLPFTDIATTSGSNFGLGRDYSGNANYWNTNNISVTAGTTYDSMIDSPTNAAGTSTGIGNYAVMNPLDNTGNTVSEGNLKVNGGIDKRTLATIGMTSGKWYCEATIGSFTTCVVGLTRQVGATSYIGSDANSYGYENSGNKINNATFTAYGASYTTNDVIGIAFDADAGTLTFYKNNTSQGTAFSSLTSGPYFFACGSNNPTAFFNFGQRPFSYTPPTGYKALNTFNLPTPTIANGALYNAATLYTGTGSNQTISNAQNNGGNNPNLISFQPDFAWVKSRSNIYNHVSQDSVVGAGNILRPSTNDAILTGRTDILNGFSSSGFLVGVDQLSNLNGATYVGWQWKGGGTGVTNNSGTITSTVSANTTAGFSVVTWTAGGAGTTIGHGLGVAPNMIIVKDRSVSADWCVYTTTTGAGAFLKLNSTAASAADTTMWGNTTPTSTTFKWGYSTGDSMVAYCFAAVRGYSAFGSYTGNGSADGPFIYTGFRPRYVLVKRTDAANFWLIMDSSRSTYNVMGLGLTAESAQAEFSWNPSKDFLSNGFKVRTADVAENASGGTYIYAAFAENPFNYSRAR